MKKSFLIYLVILAGSFNLFAQSNDFRGKNKIEFDTINLNYELGDLKFQFEIINGKQHNYPSFAIWIETMDEKLLNELFVTQSVATGVFRYGAVSGGKWVAGERRYAAALPYFFHKKNPQGIPPDSKNPLPDAITGATPGNNLFLKTSVKKDKLPDKFRILLEVNQPWDFNDFWHNAKYGDDDDYKSSAQPSIVYAVTVDLKNPMDEYFLNPIGHGHFAGKDGNLYTDLSNFTTALDIFRQIKLKVFK